MRNVFVVSDWETVDTAVNTVTNDNVIASRRSDLEQTWAQEHRTELNSIWVMPDIEANTGLAIERQNK